MEGKKISFGFLKTKKQDKLVTAEKKEYIECVEEKAIKVVGSELTEEAKPLIIPMKPNTLITAEKLKEIAAKVENFEEPEVKIEKEEEKAVPENETLDQMAVRELMEGAKKIKKENEAEEIVVPINAKPVMEGQAEATLDDYESVPIQDFGLAMLRGMGWTPGKDQSKYKQPQLRPKGLGLGADKVIKDKEKNKATKDKEEELSIVKNSYVKITTGKYNGLYGKVISLDEENGRVMVDITMKKETVSLSEFMMQAVTKAEYEKQSKVINSESYEEYKKKEMLKNSKSLNSKTEETRKEGTSSKKSNDTREMEKREERRNKDEKYSNGNNRHKEERYRKESTSSEEDKSRHRKKNKKKYSSNESLSSESDHKHKSLDRRRNSSSDPDKNYSKNEKSHRSKSAKEKRDIDKKRKGKKKKRDRDRSPNYKKHRK